MTLGHTQLTHGGTVPVVQRSPRTAQDDQNDQALSRLSRLSSLVSKYLRCLRRSRREQVEYFDFVAFEWEATGYIIGDDFYIAALRLISLTDSLITIVYLLLKQNPDYSVEPLRTLFPTQEIEHLQNPSTKAGTIPPRNRNIIKESNKDRYAVRLNRIKYEIKNKAYIEKNPKLGIKSKITAII